MTATCKRRRQVERIERLEAQVRTLLKCKELTAVVPDIKTHGYINKRGAMIRGEKDWLERASKACVYEHYVCALLNWSFCQDELKSSRLAKRGGKK